MTKTMTRDAGTSETRSNRMLRYLLMALLAVQALFVGGAPFLVLVSLDSFRELSFGDDNGPEVELNTIVIAAVFGLMALVCAYGVVLLHRHRTEGAIMGAFVGSYLIYVGAVPVFLLDRNDYLLMDVPRGLAMLALGLLLLRRRTDENVA